MGNCIFGGFGEVDGIIKVITSNGGIMEFYPPITAGSITSEFPGQGIFLSHDFLWKPLPHREDLLVGKSYYLLPLNDLGSSDEELVVRPGHVRSNSIPTSLITPYRMSLDYRGMLKRSYTEVLSNRHNNHSINDSAAGFWKVKLVITPKQLLEILSEENSTQELIESMRTVAKCGKGVSSSGFPDQWSLSSSRNASSMNESFVDI